VSGRIVLHLDQGLGWTAPVFVAGCGDCGTELARSTDQAVAERTARRTRCPACGTRAARRLPGTTSLATDVALARGRGLPPAGAARSRNGPLAGRARSPRRPVPTSQRLSVLCSRAPVLAAWPPTPPLGPNALEGGESPCPRRGPG
jgi:hypothetical protein